MGPVDSLALRMLAQEGIARPMRILDACRRYQLLVVQGLAIELAEEHYLFRRFMLTESGRKLAAEMAANRLPRVRRPGVPRRLTRRPHRRTRPRVDYARSGSPEA